jgi:hypothetical protein
VFSGTATEIFPMRENSRIQRPLKISFPVPEEPQEAPVPAQNQKKPGRKGLLKGTDRRAAVLGRQAMARQNARRLPTRQMNSAR